MDSRLNLELKQRQQQTLTPMQMQFVRVLEMNGPEVEDAVREAIDENPALEIVDEDPAEHFDETPEEMQRADYASEEEMPETQRRDYVMGPSGRGLMYDVPVGERGDTLMEAIMRQLGESGLSDYDMWLAEYVAGNIDDNGYLERTPQAIADDATIESGNEVSRAEVDRVLDRIRRLDPAGVGAVDLRDCLLLQLKRKTESEGEAGSLELSVAKEIVEHYFDLFSKMHFDRLKATLGVDNATFDGALALIRTLNPKPGALVGGGAADDRTRHITPDFIVDADPVDGVITVSLPNSLPQLSIERSFAADMDDDGRSGRSVSLFIRQKRDEAQTFIKILEMRQQTLFNVMSAIVKLQRDFFLTDDVMKLKPMILKDVSALTGYDLSVVSRATAGKYVATAGGIYPLRFFFSERPTEGSDASAHEIMATIKQLVAEEPAESPLSDATLTAELEKRGYNIARRTVAKYRERLGIPVGRLRKLKSQ